ncbi:XdhC family protein [Acidithiobacillus sulfuriphilus]|uniref:XdhC family protein n=1 Tax=Acidithiobacillus sulfuriphilus TaxID=1867749 RepID=UPI003F5FB0C8
MSAMAQHNRPLLPVREAVVIRVQGSAPAAVGASLRLLEDGSLVGTVGGGHMEYQVSQALQAAHAVGSQSGLNFTLGPAGDQCCGGQVEIRLVNIPVFFSELYQAGASRVYQIDPSGLLRLVAGVTHLGRQIGPTELLAALVGADGPGIDCDGRCFVVPAPRRQALWIFGAGHVGRAIATMSQDLDFSLSVFDHRSDWADPRCFPPEVTLVDTWSWADLQAPPADAMVLIMTYSHAMDYQILEHFIEKPLAYLGVIASRSKAVRFIHALSRSGHSAPDYLHIPMGLPGMGKKAPEIAISVLAELLHLRQQKSGVLPRGKP